MSEAPHDDLLAAVLAGDLAPDDPAVEALRREDPAARRRLDQLLQLQHALEVAEAVDAAQPADVARVSELFGRLADATPDADTPAPAGIPTAEPPSAPPGRRSEADPAPGPRSWGAALQRAAAALLLAAVAWWALTPGDTDPAWHLALGPDATLSATAPLGDVDDYALFACELPDGLHVGRVELSIWSAGDGADATPRRRETLTAPRWEPDAATRATLPDALRWELSVYDAQDQWIGAARGQARRSGR